MCPYPNDGSSGDSARLKHMLMSGERRMEQLLARFGGTIGLSDVAELLAVPKSAVMAKVDRRELITISAAQHQALFPCFQFDGDKRCIIPGLRRFLAGLPDWPDNAIVRFLLVRHAPQRSDEIPLDLIRHNRVTEALKLATSCYEQRP